jgi:hypothetical protein
MTLRQARRLDQRIASTINQTISTMAAMPIYGNYLQDDVADIVEKHRAGFDKAVSTNLALIVARGEVRRTIQLQNEQSGINKLIAERKDIERTIQQLKQYTDPYGAPGGGFNRGYGAVGRIIEPVETVAETRRLMNERGEISPNAVLSFSAVSTESLERMQQALVVARKRLDDVNDLLTQSNSTNSIKLTARTTELLNSVGCL